MLLAAPPPPPGPPSISALTQGDHDFAANLYKAALSPAGNLFLSPASVRIALAMTASGAMGNTAAEMQSVLKLPGDAKQTNADYAALLAEWNARVTAPGKEAPDHPRAQAEKNSITLRVVNRLWGQKGHKFRASFLSTLADGYRAPLEELDFAHALEKSRERINAWVAEQTANKILDLIPTGVLQPATKLVLTNAVYFKAEWTHSFNEGATRPADFVSGADKLSVPTMSLTETFKYGELDTAQVVELPYADGSLSMVVVLPAAKDGLAALEQSLSGASFDRWTSALAAQQVHLALPKFKMGSSFALSEALQALGIKDAFHEGKADLSGMDGSHKLFLSQVVQKTFIAVDEKGTEAAAATAVMVASRAMKLHNEPPPKEFKADHPFFFFLRDVKSGTILFAGRVMNPAA
jgi:serpin B